MAPADVTMALAKGARTRGGEIHRQTKVTAIQQKPSGEWLVQTDKGDITGEHVVLATGSWARQTAAMVGLDIPVIAGRAPVSGDRRDRRAGRAQEAGPARNGGAARIDASYYMREERQGLILGPYEKGAPAWAVDGVPDSFGQELLAPDIERLEPHINAAIARVPIFGKAGIKDCINGPIPYTPDGSPLVGPAWGLKNFWLNEGHSFGITAAGGSGWQLAEWMVEGEPGIDTWDVDPRRFGDYANKRYTKIKNEECYEHVFITHYPLEERPAARPAKAPPCYDRQKELGAVFGQKFGWERANWFAPKGTEPKDKYSFRRTNFFEPVREEVQAVRERVGLLDLTGFSKFEVSGPGAEAFLDRLVANRLPKKVGRIQPRHVCDRKGGVVSEWTITRLGPERFYLVSAAAAEPARLGHPGRDRPANGGVDIRDLTLDRGVLVVAGPRSRDLLKKITDADLSNEAFPWLTMQNITVDVTPLRALRVNFVGELGWELHHPLAYQIDLWDAIWKAGTGVRHPPLRHPRHGQPADREELPLLEDGPIDRILALESGMGRFVQLNKGEFVGREALVSSSRRALPYSYVTLAVEAKDSDPWGNEPIYDGETMVGRATSGAYGYTLGKSMAVGYVRPDPRQARHEARARDAWRAAQMRGAAGIALGPGERAAPGLRGAGFP